MYSEQAIKRREIVDLRINEIQHNKKEALNVPAEENKKEEDKKEENEDSDDEEGKVRQNIYTNQQIAKCSVNFTPPLPWGRGVQFLKKIKKIFENQPPLILRKFYHNFFLSKQLQ